jgi:lysophospholipase L1-like esterase|nr:MAG TPA: GDSL like Lipase Acylhydrolase [Caudoviricetes sp.]
MNLIIQLDRSDIVSRIINLGNVTGTLQQEIENQKFRDVYQKVNLTFISGGYYRQEKRFTEAYVEDAGFSYCIVPVLKGEKYICRGVDYYNARACLTWRGDGSTDNTPKEYPDTQHTTPNLGQYEFTIEENGIMVVNSRNLNGNNILYKYHNKNVNDKFDGKTVLFTGDSICNGYGWDVNEAHSNRKIICLTNPPGGNYYNLGWSQVFAENHRGCYVYSYGVNGTRITNTGPNAADSILSRIQIMNENADYVILSGHMNDVFNKVELGTLYNTAEGNNAWKSAIFDTNTFYGAMEQLFRDSILKWKNAKVGFIITPKNCNCMKSVLYPINQDAFVNAIIDCCKKWCIPYLDLYHDCGLVNAFPDINQMYFSDDQMHPNEKAYRERLSDLVEIFMSSI